MSIQNNIPIPKKRTSAKLGQCKYDFAKLKVEQSFPVDEKKRFSVATLAKRYGDKQNPKKEFTVRRDDSGKMRCWRTV